MRSHDCRPKGVVEQLAQLIAKKLSHMVLGLKLFRLLRIIVVLLLQLTILVPNLRLDASDQQLEMLRKAMLIGALSGDNAEAIGDEVLELVAGTRVVELGDQVRSWEPLDSLFHLKNTIERHTDAPKLRLLAEVGLVCFHGLRWAEGRSAAGAALFELGWLIGRIGVNWEFIHLAKVGHDDRRRIAELDQNIGLLRIAVKQAQHEHVFVGFDEDCCE